MSALTQVLFLCLLAGAAGADSQGTCTGESCQANDHMLLQSKSVVKKDTGKQTPVINLDHAHIVCHSQGCEEAEAELAGIQARMALASEKLAQCSTSRAQLKSDLENAVAMRERVEAALNDCSSNRKVLQTAIDDCAKSRARKTAALAECTASRQELEQELAQCVDVDRPEAEKALAECNEERAKLQKELEELQGGSSGSPAPSPARGPSPATALLQTEAKEEVEASVATRVNRIQARLQELKVQEDLTVAKLQKLIRTIAVLAEKLEIRDAEFDALADGLMEHFRTEEDLMGQYAENERKFVNATKNYLQTISGPLAEIRDRVAQARAEEGKSLADLASAVVSQSEGTANLLQLKADFNDARHKAAQADETWHQENIQKLQALLDEKTKHGSEEECDELRGRLVTAKIDLETTQALLEECLLTKVELTKKLEDASKATSLAQAALEECNTACASMQAQLEECNTACASLAASLEECLKAKEELSAAIEECHKKRDEARAALEECLKAKAELQEQINALKQGSLLQEDEYAAVVNHSRSMETIVSILKELAERFLELVSQHQEQDTKISKAVNKMKRILATEQSMENSAASANNAANEASGNSLGSAIQQVASRTETMLDELEAADATNNAVLDDIQ